MRSRQRVALALAVSLPVAFTAVAAARGYSLDRTLASRSLVAYVAAVALLGVAAAVAWRRGAVVAAGVGALGAVALPIRPVVGSAPGGGAPLGHHVLVGDAALAVALVTLVGAVEFAARNRAALGTALTPRALRVGAAVGGVHALAVAAGGWHHELDWAVGAADPATALWVVAGAVLVGGAAGTLAAGYRVVLPAATVLAVLSWAWLASPVDPAPARAVTPLAVYGLFWVGPLVAALLAGAVEAELRAAVGRARHAAGA